MKISVTWTRLAGTTQCHHMRIREGNVTLSPLCSLPLGGKKITSAWLFEKEAGAGVTQCVGMETGQTETVNDLNAEKIKARESEITIGECEFCTLGVCSTQSSRLLPFLSSSKSHLATSRQFPAPGRGVWLTATCR